MQPIDFAHATGYWHDGWAGTTVEFECTPPAGTKHIRVIFEKTPHIDNLLVFVTVNGLTIRRQVMASEVFFVDVPLTGEPGTAVISVVAEGAFVPKDQGINDDTRTLSYMLRGVEARFAGE
ncbi:MAG: hypothetical protein EBU67_10425 [Actinobacteria bacterium]|jgi:hypothetical protein|nr:hypothetical protein [Actinomycetota bacterium]